MGLVEKVLMTGVSQDLRCDRAKTSYFFLKGPDLSGRHSLSPSPLPCDVDIDRR